MQENQLIVHVIGVKNHNHVVLENLKTSNSLISIEKVFRSNFTNEKAYKAFNEWYHRYINNVPAGQTIETENRLH